MEFKNDRMNSNDDLIVVKSNKLIEASYKLTVGEMRVVLSCISQVRPKQCLSKIDEFEINIKDFSKLYQINRATAYRELKRVVDSLYERTFFIKKKGKDRDGYTKTRWISSAEYVESEGKIRVCFAHKIIPYLTKLKDSYTKYRIKYTSNLKSVHSLRIYEIAMKWSMVGQVKYSIPDFVNMLALGDTYLQAGALKQRVLNRSEKEINAQTDLRISWELIKTGRKYTAVILHITDPKGRKVSNQKIAQEAKQMREAIERQQREEERAKRKKGYKSVKDCFEEEGLIQ